MKSSNQTLAKRALMVTPLLAGAALLLGACGDAGSASNTTALQLSSTDYQTIAPVESTSTTTTIAGQPAGTVTTDVTEYTVQSGDVPVNVAKRFGVTLDALNLANADTAGYSGFYVGLVIKIPAGATIPDPTATTTTVAGATPAQTTTTIAGGGDNCAPGSYVIEDGDLPSTVAKKFDVTLDQLDAANVNTKGYKNFIVGITIVIPAKSDC